MMMNRLFLGFFVFFGLFFSEDRLWSDNSLSIIPAPAAVATASGSVLVVAVLDQEYVLFECQAAQEARKVIESQRSTFQTEIDQQEKELRQEEEALQEAQRTLSEKEFLEKRTAFENRVGEVHKKVALRRSQLEQSFNKARKAIIAKMGEIIERLSKEKGFSLVFPKGAVLYAKQHLDMTQDVLKELNTLLPTVEIEASIKEPHHD